MTNKESKAVERWMARIVSYYRKGVLTGNHFLGEIMDVLTPQNTPIVLSAIPEDLRFIPRLWANNFDPNPEPGSCNEAVLKWFREHPETPREAEGKKEYIRAVERALGESEDT